MPDPEKPAPLKGLGERIAATRDSHQRRQARKSSLASTSGLGLGLRIATELVSALAVGVGIGLILDHWLGTAPWLLILFFILGAAAGMTNLIRTANEADRAQARERAQQPGARERAQETETREPADDADTRGGAHDENTARRGHGGQTREG
jgi:ATP synthase protein I